METFFTILHLLAALFLVFVILIQGGNAGGVGAAFGGGNSAGLFGASGATSFLGKVTYVMAGVFMATSITLSVWKGNSGKTGLTDRLKEAADKKTEAPAQTPSDPATPAATPKAEETPKPE